jgi:hypothetical protein
LLEVRRIFSRGDEFALWLELLPDDFGIRTENIDWLYEETGELMRIFITMVSKLRKRGE